MKAKIDNCTNSCEKQLQRFFFVAWGVIQWLVDKCRQLGSPPEWKGSKDHKVINEKVLRLTGWMNKNIGLATQSSFFWLPAPLRLIPMILLMDATNGCTWKLSHPHCTDSCLESTLFPDQPENLWKSLPPNCQSPTFKLNSQETCTFCIGISKFAVAAIQQSFSICNLGESTRTATVLRVKREQIHQLFTICMLQVSISFDIYGTWWNMCIYIYIYILCVLRIVYIMCVCVFASAILIHNIDAVLPILHSWPQPFIGVSPN